MKLKLSVQYKDNHGLDRRPLSLSLIKAEGFDTGAACYLLLV